MKNSTMICCDDVTHSIHGHLSMGPPWSSSGAGKVCVEASLMISQLPVESFPPVPNMVPSVSRKIR